MRYISVFSGIEAASVAWEPLGWEPVAFAEIDEFPSAVLRARYPDVPNLGDITKVDWRPYRGTVDVVVGGSPCQSFSVAGKREGLSGESGLMFEYIRCVQELMPEWFVWENVPGALSVERGGAFRQLLASMDGLGYGLAWRVLDAQFFGVAQRRRRVFLVGHLGDMRACEVLFEPESMRWDTPSSREKRKALARAAGRGSATGGDAGSLTPWDVQSKQVFTPDSVSPTLSAGGNNWNPKNVQPCVIEPKGCLTPWDNQAKRIYAPESIAPTLNRGMGKNTQPSVLTFAQNTRDELRVQGDGTLTGALSASAGAKQQTYVMQTAHTQSNGSNVSEEDLSYTIDTNGTPSTAYSIPSAAIGAPNSGTNAQMAVEELCPTIKADGKAHAVVEPTVMASTHTNAEIGAGGVSPTLTAHSAKDAPVLATMTTCSQRSARRTAASSSSTTSQSGAEGSSSSRVIAMANDNAKTAMNEEVCGSLKVGGGSDDCVASNGEDVVSALCARDFKGVGSQYVSEGKVIACQMPMDSLQECPRRDS